MEVLTSAIDKLLNVFKQFEDLVQSDAVLYPLLVYYTNSKVKKILKEWWNNKSFTKQILKIKEDVNKFNMTTYN